MKIVVFSAGGLMGLRPVEALSAHHDVAVVLPRPSATWKWWAKRILQWFHLYHRDPLVTWVRANSRPVYYRTRSGDRIIHSLVRNFAPDLGVIATFPGKLDASLLDLPLLGTLNIHPSLLPRHRGPNPYFWTYYRNDPETGVTIHVATDDIDAGPVVAQAKILMGRGVQMKRLYADLADCGGRLIVETVLDLDRKLGDAAPQDHGLATDAPRVDRVGSMVDFENWDVERVWHFLAGLYPRFVEVLNREDGSRAEYRGVIGYERLQHENDVGSIVEHGLEWMLWCRGGFVRLEKQA